MEARDYRTKFVERVDLADGGIIRLTDVSDTEDLIRQVAADALVGLLPGFFGEDGAVSISAVFGDCNAGGLLR